MNTKQDRPNILFVITDQQSAEAMSCRMGGEYINTPAMDSIAREGMICTRAYAANPLCLPQRNAMFTGRYSHETGITQNLCRQLDPAEFVDMGTYFEQNGYHTAYFGKRHLCFDVDGSFQTTVDNKHDAKTLEQAVAFLSRNHEQPFLCVVSFMNPHNVCQLARGQALPDGPIGEAPPPEMCPPAPTNLAPQQNEPDTMTIMRQGYHANPMFPVGDFTPEQWRQLRWGYYRIVEKVDAQIGVLLASLRETGLAENTVIVFLSDHGECAGAHGFNQKTVFYEESVRVPLIVRMPGGANPGACDKLVNTGIDILPTLLDIAGADVPAHLPGRSLKRLAMGQTVPTWRNHLLAQNDMRQAGSLGAFSPSAQGRMVRSDRYKYCVYSRGERRESLVDMQHDPWEMKNVAYDPAYHEILMEHRALLARFAQEHDDRLATDLLADDVKPIPFTEGARGGQ